ncbi:MAG: MptD family putative ECF transporter S component, partial [Sneathia sanguinegens]
PIGYIGNFIPLLISRDKIYAKLVASEGVEFANQFMSSVPNWMVIPCILLAMLGGFLGCTIGIVILKKHFEKAGMLK